MVEAQEEGRRDRMSCDSTEHGNLLASALNQADFRV